MTVRPPGPDNKPVARFGAYELVRPLGSGGMGEVWLAHRSAGDGLAKTVALKFLPRHRDGDARARLDFQREVRLSMHLSHSAIVHVFDVGEHEGRACMVMEWVDGVDLARLLEYLGQRGQRLPLPAALHVIIQVLRALDYAHNLHHEGKPLGMVHRDVSPHNILISTSGDVKLTDFGIARAAQEETSGAHIRGKLRYMAPEQFAGAPRSASFDLYAVGAVIHELLSGERFRGHEEDGELYRAILEGAAPPLTRDDVPSAIMELRTGLLAVEPEGRPASAQICLEALAGVSVVPGGAEELGRRCRALMGVDSPRSGEHEGAHIAPGAASISSEAPGDSASTATMARPAEARRTSSLGRRATTSVVSVGVSLLAVVALVTLARRTPGGGQPADTVVDAGERPRESPRGGAPPKHPMTLTSSELDIAPGLTDVREEHGTDASGVPRPMGQGARLQLEKLRASARTPSTLASSGGGSGDARDARESETGGTEDAARSHPATRPRVTVTFRASEYDFAYVRLRGKSYALEPSVNVRLPVGRHRIQMRESVDAPWRDLGELRLQAGERYDARLRRPGRVDLQAR